MSTDDLTPMREHIEHAKSNLEAWIAGADPHHVHDWHTTVCGGNHARTNIEHRWSGGTIGFDDECACGARKHLGL